MVTHWIFRRQNGNRMRQAVLHCLLLFFVITPVNADAPPARQMDIASPEHLEAYLASINYTLQNWNNGDRSVPRVYLDDVPLAWREEYSGKLATPDKKRFFFFLLGPITLRANELVAQQRSLVQQLQKNPDWDAAMRNRLNEIAGIYSVPAPSSSQDGAAFAKLLRRVDQVPVSLALAQGAIESGWGTSRFAAEGNALFGQWSWDDDAIAPADIRTELGNYGIRAFKTPFESVAAYMHNLNTHHAYTSFRKLREQMRARNQPLSGIVLAKGLVKYSERGQVYVDEVRSVIRINQLQDTDLAFLRDMQPVILHPDQNAPPVIGKMK